MAIAENMEVRLRDMDNIICKISGHSWNDNDCYCSRGSCREVRHDWNKCICKRCGLVRDENHNWVGCKCKTCGRVHDFPKRRCTRCGINSDSYNTNIKSLIKQLGYVWITKIPAAYDFWNDGGLLCDEYVYKYIPMETKMAKWELLNEDPDFVIPELTKALSFKKNKIVYHIDMKGEDGFYIKREFKPFELPNDKIYYTEWIKSIPYNKNEYVKDINMYILDSDINFIKKEAKDKLFEGGKPATLLSTADLIKKNAHDILAALSGDNNYEETHKKDVTQRSIVVENLTEIIWDCNKVSYARLKAAEKLGSIGGKKALKTLINILENNIIDWDVRWKAAKALGKIGDVRAVETLVESLGSADWSVQEEAAKALGNIGDIKAIKPLVKSLGDGAAVAEAAKALVKIGNSGVEALVQAFGDKVSYTAVTALGNIGNTEDVMVVNFLIAMLKCKSKYFRGEAAEALGKIGDKRAVKSLIDTLKDEDSDVRWRTAEALGKIGYAKAVKPLIAALKDENATVRWRAAEALGKTRDARTAVEPLIVALKDEWGYTRKHAAEALGKIGDKKAAEPLIALLKYKKNECWEGRCEAARALGIIRDTKAVEPLIDVLKDDNDEYWWGCVRREAVTALGEIGDTKAVDPLIAVLNSEAIEALGNIGDVKAVEPLIVVLKNETPGAGPFRNIIAAKALGKIGDTKAVEPLVAALKNKYEHIREEAARSLGNIRDSNAVEPLIVTLKDEDWNVRRAAVVALGEISDTKAIGPVERMALNDYNSRVRYAAKKNLGKIRGE